MINKDGGTIFRFYGGDIAIMWETAIMRGDIELKGGPPSPPLGKTLFCVVVVEFVMLWKPGFSSMSWSTKSGSKTTETQPAFILFEWKFSCWPPRLLDCLFLLNPSFTKGGRANPPKVFLR